jgi:hypothetical protein
MPKIICKETKYKSMSQDNLRKELVLIRDKINTLNMQIFPLKCEIKEHQIQLNEIMSLLK